MTIPVIFLGRFTVSLFGLKTDDIINITLYHIHVSE
jgi:hypothetical protein